MNFDRCEAMNLMKETKRDSLLLLGGNRLNKGVVDKFQKNGYKVIVVDWNDQPDLIGDKHLCIDVKDSDSIMAELNRSGDLDKIVFCYSSIDQAVPSVARINKAIGLHTISDEAIQNATSKSAMTGKWKMCGLLGRVSQSFKDCSSDVETICADMTTIIKPDDSASSRGITVVGKGDIKQLKHAFIKAKCESNSGSVIVEEFVAGTEYTVEMLGDSYGNVAVYGISKKQHTHNTINNKIAVKLHYNCLPFKKQEKIAAFAIKCYKSLGFTSSLGHLEVLEKSDGTFSPIEIGARSSGFIASDLVDIVSGRDYLSDLLEIQRGGKTSEGLLKQTDLSAVYFFYDFPPNHSVIKEKNILDYMDSSIKSRYYDRSKIINGCHFAEIMNDNERIGYEILEGPKQTLTDMYVMRAEICMMQDILKM